MPQAMKFHMSGPGPNLKIKCFLRISSHFVCRHANLFDKNFNPKPKISRLQGSAPCQFRTRPWHRAHGSPAIAEQPQYQHCMGRSHMVPQSACKQAKVGRVHLGSKCIERMEPYVELFAHSPDPGNVLNSICNPSHCFSAVLPPVR